jgi:chemotaxis protein MotB
MKGTAMALIMMCSVTILGCVGSGTHQRTLAELEETRETLAKTAAEKARVEQERAAEKARLEQERAAKEAEINRLTQTHADLTKSLEAEIARGDIRIKQVRDRLTINMVDRVLFDSGQGQVKPAGLRVLKQVCDILKNVTDKQIRIEGHTDNVPIGGKLKTRFPSNWELSTARATSVVRYLIEEGGVDRAYLSAVGYADMRPVASNATEEGRTANRRIEITLYPKDLSEIASQIKP